VVVRALIVEDEPLARKTLRDFAADIDWLEIIGEATDGQIALRMIDDLRPDLVFLDVQIPEMTGLQVLNQARHEPTVVFTTGYDRYAVSAFELEAVDYLLKPFGRERFHQALERVRRNAIRKSKLPSPPSQPERLATVGQNIAEPLSRFFVRDARRRIVQVRLDDVSRLIANDDYVAVHVGKDSYLVHITLKDFESRLDHTKFRRVHRSAIVNLDHIAACESINRRLLLRFDDGSELFASRAGSKHLQDLII